MPEKRILIVDDEPDLLETIQVTLEMEGYECLVAYDGFRGLDRARTEKPDLIGRVILLVAIPETLVILGFAVAAMIILLLGGA